VNQTLNYLQISSQDDQGFLDVNNINFWIIFPSHLVFLTKSPKVLLIVRGFHNDQFCFQNSKVLSHHIQPLVKYIKTQLKPLLHKNTCCQQCPLQSYSLLYLKSSIIHCVFLWTQMTNINYNTNWWNTINTNNK